MKKKYLQLIFIIAVTIFFQASAFSLERVHPSDLTYKLIKLNPPVPNKTVLKNGMVIYTLEDHDLPIFAIKAVIKTGAIYVSEEKTGLASIPGSVMRSGGTKNMTWKEIDEKKTEQKNINFTEFESPISNSVWQTRITIRRR